MEKKEDKRQKNYKEMTERNQKNIADCNLFINKPEVCCKRATDKKFIFYLIRNLSFS